MKHRHDMPFGSELLPGGGVRFRLWAPGIAEVRLSLADNAFPLPMEKDRAGWHTLTVPDARAGTRYAFVLPDGLRVPDPASRSNPDDVHAPSEVIDPQAFDWPDDGWHGRPWEEAAIYELHVGTFSASGDFAGVIDRLDYLVDLGVTAIELMPLADFPGHRGWGYDGVLPFAPESAYGRPDDLKRLIAAAHARGLMVLLDVVYNHFGPEGNYLHAYAREFFNPRHHTPWGAAINFDGPHNRTVRDFFIHNALFWLEEYRFDGLRLDAVHAICDDSATHIVSEIAAAIRRGPGRERHVHLILENEDNSAHYLERQAGHTRNTATAQWNDDIHHAFHVLATGETDGYYVDYATDPAGQLARCLSEGFAYQGDPSPFRDGARRGEPSAHLPPGAFIDFLQNHDQIGNRAFGERLCHLAPAAALDALTAVLLLAPQPPMLFMGEEFAAAQPFLFFCNFGPELAQAVTDGRRREFARFAKFADPAVRERIPDPNAERTFAACVLDWDAYEQPGHRERLALCRQLLALRQRHLVPHLAGMTSGQAHVTRLGERGMSIAWTLGDKCRWTLLANLANLPVAHAPVPDGRCIFTTPWWNPAPHGGFITLPPWSVAWFLTEPEHR